MNPLAGTSGEIHGWDLVLWICFLVFSSRSLNL